MNKKTFWSSLSLVFVFLTITVGSITQPLLACVMPPPDPPPIWVRFLTPTTIKITVHNFTTFGGGPGQFCACGLTHLGVGIQSIDSVRVVLAGTDTVLESFSFNPNDKTTSGFNDNHPSPNWQGFLSGVSATIEPNIPVDLQFFGTIQEGADFSQVASDLAGGRVGTDEGTEDGSLTGGHLSITEPGGIEEETGCNMTGTWLDDFNFQWDLRQAMSGSISGGVTQIPSCAGPWPVTGEYMVMGNAFSLTATCPCDPTCSDPMAPCQSFSYSGTLADSCNTGGGTWQNCREGDGTFVINRTGSSNSNFMSTSGIAPGAPPSQSKK